MKLQSQEAPHIRSARNTRGVMADAVAALSFLYAMAFYYYGPRVLILGAGSVLVCLLTDILCNLMLKRRHNIRDLSAIVTGMILPLMMPASIPYSVLAVAGVFGILVAKAPFGGVGHNVFNPAAAGFSFAVVCYSDIIFSYPMPGAFLPLWGKVEYALAASPAFTLRRGGIPDYDVIDMILGKYPGPMGATNILVLIACLLYLVFRGTIRWPMPVSFFATVALLAFLFPRSAPTGLASVGFELATGLLLFGGIFLLGDPVTTPKREWAKAAFGMIAGVMVMIFRRFGGLEEAITFALLLMNAMAWGFDLLGEKAAGHIRRKKLGTRQNPKASK